MKLGFHIPGLGRRSRGPVETGSAEPAADKAEALPTFEFRIPIAPTPAFYSNIRLAAMSLARLGEPYKSAPIIVSVGYNADLGVVRDVNSWAVDYPIVWYAPPSELWDQGGFEEGRFGHRFPEDVDSEVVIHCDADTCIVGRFDDLLRDLGRPGPRLAACMAHGSPFGGSPEENETRWRNLFRSAHLAPPSLGCTYSMMSREEAGGSPPYFNAGFVAFNRDAWRRILPAVDLLTPFARNFLRPMGRAQFSIQAALSLALARCAEVEVRHLGLEYNCPNDDAAFDHGVRSEDDIRVIHFLRKDEFDRHRFLSEPAMFDTFLKADLKGRVNRRLRDHILSLPDIAL